MIAFNLCLQLFFHGKNMDSLHKHIDPKYLPKVYGGVRPNYPYQHWFINLKNNAAVVKGTYNTIITDCRLTLNTWKLNCLRFMIVIIITV